MPTIGNLKLGYWSSLPTTHITEKYCWANWGRRIWLGDFNKRVFLQLQFALQFLTTNSNYFRNSRRECSPLDNSGCPLCPLRVWFFRRDLWERAGCTCEPCAWRSRRSRISCQAQARGKTSIWKLAACGREGSLRLGRGTAVVVGTGRHPQGTTHRQAGISWRAPRQEGRSGFRHSRHVVPCTI